MPLFNAKLTPCLPLRYVIKGQRDAPTTLVFLNGLFHGESAWIKQQRFSGFSHCQMLYIDYPGCGNNALNNAQQHFTFADLALAVHDLIEHLMLSQVILIGYSLGGMLALEIAHLFPQRITRLVLLNSADEIGIKGQWLMQNVISLLTQRVPLTTVFSQIYPWFFSDAYLKKLHNMHEFVLKNYTDYNADRQGLLAFLAACQRRKCREYSLEVPVLLIDCTGDLLFPPDVVAAFTQHSPWIVRVSLPAQTHVANLECAAEVNRLINNFITHSITEQYGAHHAL